MYKVCLECDKTKSLTDFHKKGSKYRARCKVCRNKKRKERYLKNKNREIINDKIYKKNNPEMRIKISRRSDARRRLKKFKYKVSNMSNRQLILVMPSIIRDTDYFSGEEIYNDIRSLQMEMFGEFMDRKLDYSKVEKKAKERLEEWLGEYNDTGK